MIIRKQYCDICANTEELEEFVDGATRMGPWAYMCTKHYAEYGVGLGIGRGQHFVWDEEQKSYVKIGG